jgi:hypothetical protein
MDTFLTGNQILHSDDAIIVNVPGQMTSKIPVGYFRTIPWKVSDTALTSASFTTITAFQVTASY